MDITRRHRTIFFHIPQSFVDSTKQRSSEGWRACVISNPEPNQTIKMGFAFQKKKKPDLTTAHQQILDITRAAANQPTTSDSSFHSTPLNMQMAEYEQKGRHWAGNLNIGQIAGLNKRGIEHNSAPNKRDSFSPSRKNAFLCSPSTPEDPPSFK